MSLDHCIHCFDALHAYWEGRPIPTYQCKEESEMESYPLFVTWNLGEEKNMILRGCLGTFEPSNLETALSHFAIESASKDPRFDPIRLEESSNLSCSVSLLHSFQEIRNQFDWELGIHGISIEYIGSGRSRRTATFLPHVAPTQGWDKDATIRHLMQKAGISAHTSSMILKDAKFTRYEAKVSSMSYVQYQNAKN